MILNLLLGSVRKSERERFRFFFLLSGFLVLGQTLGLVGAESLLLAALGASVLPKVFVLASVVTVLLSLLYAFGVDRARNDNYFIQILGFFALLIAGCTFAVTHVPTLKTVGLVSLFCLYYANFAVCTNHFWTFTADFFDSLQAKRLFPLFTVGASMGGLTGGIVASFVAGLEGGSTLLLWGWVASFGLAAFWLRSHRGALRRWGPLEIEESDETSMDGMKSSIRYLKSSRLGKLLVLSALFMVTSLFVSQYLYSGIFVEAYPEPDDLAKFFGIFLACANGLELLLEIAVTPWLLSRLGIANANLFHPLLTLASFVGLGFMPGIPAAVFARLNRETLENAVGAPVRNLLFNALPARLRGRMRAFLEGMVVYSGMAFAGVFLFLWEELHPSDTSSNWLLASGGFVLALGFFVTNFALKSDYFEQLVGAIRDGRIELGESSSTLETLPAGNLLELWNNVIGTNHQSPLLVQLAHTLGERGLWDPLKVGMNSSNTRVRLTSLEAYAGVAPRSADPFLRRAFEDRDPKVRLFALTTLENPGTLLEKCLEDPNAQVRAEAARLCHPAREDVLEALLDSPDRENHLAALSRLPRTLTAKTLEFLGSNEPQEVVAALKNLCSHDCPPSLEKLRELYSRNDTSIRQATVESLSHKGLRNEPELVELVRSALSDQNRQIRQTAVRVFVELGPTGVPTLVRVVQTESSAVAHGAISALAKIGEEESRQLFVSECLVRAKRAWCHKLEAAIHQADHPTSTARRFLILALQDSAERELTTCFRLLEAQEESKIVRSVENVLRFAHARIRSDALEVLSNLGDREATALLVHLLEEGDLVERSRSLVGKVPPPRELAALVGELAESPDRWLRFASRANQGSEALSSEGMELMERLLMLQSVPLFSAMTLEQLEAIHSCLTEQHYTKGEVIFNEGDIGDEMYIVADGQVEILLNFDSEEPLHLATVESGSYFGEMSVLDRDPRSAAARVTEDARLFVLKGEQLKELIYVMPEIAFTIFRVLSERLRRSDKRLAKRD